MKVDYLIAGQGLAGSLLAWSLQKAGKTCLVVDPCEATTSSLVAGGMIHPVTGRRISKSWNADVFIPVARERYAEISACLGKAFFYDMPVLEAFHDVKHMNEWAARSENPSIQSYLGNICVAADVPAGYNAPLGGQWTVQSGRLDVADFIGSMRDYFKQQNCFLEERIDFNDVQFNNAAVRWKEVEAIAFIDCRGYRAGEEGPFTFLPFNPSKGEVVHFQSEALPEDMVMHSSIKVIPTGKQTYVAGATYSWHALNTIPEEGGIQKLTDQLQKIVKVPFKVLKAQAAVRPSTKHRRPMIGKHPEIDRLFILNGLGSKGVMMGPFLADLMTDYLCKGVEPDAMYRNFESTL